MMRKIEKTGGEFAAAMRAGEVGRRDADGIKSLPTIIEPGRMESLHRRIPQQWIAPQGSVDGYVHHIPTIKA